MILQTWAVYLLRSSPEPEASVGNRAGKPPPTTEAENLPEALEVSSGKARAPAQLATGLSRLPWCQCQVDEIPDRYDPGITRIVQTEQILVFADDEVRLCGGSAFEDAVVGWIFLNDVQYFGWGDVITEGEQLAARVLERIAIPLELVAEHADRLGPSIASEMSMRMFPARAWPMITVAGPPKCSALI
jgi:hypothetical protein